MEFWVQDTICFGPMSMLVCHILRKTVSEKTPVKVDIEI